MKTKPTFYFLMAAVATALLVVAFPAVTQGDTVKTKDGKTYEGEVTLDAVDMLKIKVRKSATISETVTILKKDIADWAKSAPDDVEYGKIKGLIPTPSLMPASAYQAMIAKGPEAFLRSYPGSQHKPEVEKINQVLNEELAKVDKGFIKLEGDWLTPKHQRDFKALIESRILNLGIKQKAQQRNFIGALRDFERMEENYYGTPSYPEAVRSILAMLPYMGQEMQRMAKDVNFMNADFEKKILLMPEQKQAQTRQAREREEADLKKSFDADKKSGVKWYRVNQRDEEDLKNYIQMVAAEIKRLEGINLTALSLQAEELVKADELIAEDNLAAAKEKLTEATGMSTAPSSSGGGSSTSSASRKGYVSRTGSSSRRTTSSSKTGGKTSYIVKLQEKIATKEAAIAEAKAQELSAAEGAKATELVRSDAVGGVPEGTETTEGSEAPQSSGANSALNSFISSGGSQKAGEDKGTGKSQAKSSSKKPTRAPTRKPAKPADDKEEEEKKESRTVASSGGGGGGFNMMYVVWGVIGLMILSIVVMKVTGTGGAKG